MWYDLFPLHFSKEELAYLAQLQGKRLAGIHYLIWKNLSQRGGEFQALDWVVLDFEDGSILPFTAGEHSDALRIMPLDLDAETQRVELQFRGQVALEWADVSGGTVWAEAMGLPLQSIQTMEGPDGTIQNNEIQLDFGGVIMEIALNEEGLLVRKR